MNPSLALLMMIYSCEALAKVRNVIESYIFQKKHTSLLMDEVKLHETHTQLLHNEHAASLSLLGNEKIPQYLH